MQFLTRVVGWIIGCLFLLHCALLTNVRLYPKPTLHHAEPITTACNTTTVNLVDCTMEPLLTTDNSLCVLVRTYVDQTRMYKLQQQLANWASVVSNVSPEDPIGRMRVYVSNTHHQRSRSDDAEIYLVVNRTRDMLREDVPLSIEYFQLPENMVPHQKKYGYDATNLMLEHALNASETCDFFMLTNGDNQYNNGLLREVNNRIRERDNKDDIISFRFVTHHLRPTNKQLGQLSQRVPNTVVNGRFKRKHIYLGGAVLKRRVFTDICESPLRFDEPPDGWFAADWHMLKKVSECGAKQTTIPQVLFFHQ